MAGCRFFVLDLLFACLLWGAWLRYIAIAHQDSCRRVKFLPPETGNYLEGHAFFNLTLGLLTPCEDRCVMQRECVSVNIGPVFDDRVICELSNSDHWQHPEDLKPRPGWTYRGTENLCSSNPCLNKAKCLMGYTDKKYLCVCASGYTGENCEKGLKSCSDLKTMNFTAESGNYVIDPDGEGGLPPFNVTCDMNDKNGVGVTVISHDSESRTLVDGYEEAGSYSRDIHYTGTSLSQLASLTTVSSYCEQFIKYECYSSGFWFSDSNPDGWWVSRDSAKMTYWGGASVSGKCACGMTNSCADPGDDCNCDKNDNVWREDSGLLTDKSHLPVKQLRFGDTGNHYGDEKGYHTLGKLKCYGTA